MVLDVRFAVLAEWRTSACRSPAIDWCCSAPLTSSSCLPCCCTSRRYCCCCLCCRCRSSVSWKSRGRCRGRRAERCLRNCTLRRFQFSICPSRTFYTHTSLLVNQSINQSEICLSGYSNSHFKLQDNIYEGRSKRLAIQYDAQMTRANFFMLNIITLKSSR